MNIKTWPDSALSKKCAPVEKFDERLTNLLEELTDVLKDEKALGICANQLGFLECVFLIKLKNEEILEIVNPEILEQYGEQFGPEGCLSFRGIFPNIKRAKNVHAKWKNRNGEEKEGVFYDLEAREFLHEFDHTLGKTLLDNVNRAERKRILKEMK